MIDYVCVLGVAFQYVLIYLLKSVDIQDWKIIWDKAVKVDMKVYVTYDFLLNCDK
jgi:hypothetical protein